MSGGDFEGMTVEELCEWANGLLLCEFSIVEKWGDRYVEARGKNVEISMGFSRFCDGVIGRGGRDLSGMRMVNYDTLDNRKGNYHGHGKGIAFLDELEASLTRDAERLGLCAGQLRLF